MTLYFVLLDIAYELQINQLTISYFRIIDSKGSKGASARPNYAKTLLSEYSTVVRSDIELLLRFSSHAISEPN